MLQTKNIYIKIHFNQVLTLEIGLLCELEVLESLFKDRGDLKVRGKLKFVIL